MYTEKRSAAAAKSSRKKGRNIFKNNIIAWLLIFPALFLLYFFKYRPQILGTFWSFFNMKGYQITTFAGIENYRRIFADPNFWQALINTLKYIFWSIVVGYLPPIFIAICLEEICRLRTTTRFLVYFPAVLPASSVALIWFFIYYPGASGLLNMILLKIGIEPYIWLQDSRLTILYIIIMMTWTGCGPAALYYFSALQSVQHELYEAITIDGGGFFTKLRVVTLPHIYGIALLFFIKQILGVFSVMEQPMLMTDGGPNGASESLGLLIYKYGFVYNKPQFSMALGVIMFIILLFLTFFYQSVNKKIDSRS